MGKLEDKTLYEMTCYFGRDRRRSNHAMKVYGTACAIASGAGLNEKERAALGLAAILHDIGIPESERKYRCAAGKYQEKEGPPIAREILERLGCEPSLTDRVCWLIAHHHTYGAIDGMDSQILAEADLIVNIEEGEYGGKEAETILKKYFKTAEGKRIAEKTIKQGGAEQEA